MVSISKGRGNQSRGRAAVPQHCGTGDLHHKDLSLTVVRCTASPFWDQREEGITMLDQIGELINRLWGRELELKFQRMWQKKFFFNK